MKHIHSSCRICPGTCGFNLQVDRNAIVGYSADFDCPLTHGYCCPKGIAGIELQQGKVDRLTESLKRNINGEFERVDTLHAAEEIGKKLKAMVAEHGPRSLALYFGTGVFFNTLGNCFSKGWLHATGSPNLFTTTTIDQSSHWVTAGRMGVFMGGPPDAEDIDVGLVAGSNPLVAHQGWPAVAIQGLNPGENMKKARARGQKLIVVDPRITETARSATLHLQIIPGEDATLYAGIIHLIFKNDDTNEAFCKRYVTHVERLRDLVKDYTSEYVSRRTGVPASQLQEAAELLGNARRPYCGCTTGTAMTPDSNLADFLLVCINALCGGYRQAGDRVRNQQPLSGSFPPVADVFPPNRSWDEGVKCRTQNVGLLFGEFPTALFPDEILTPGKDKIRAMIVVGGNPAMAMADPDKTMAALDDLELLITLDHSVNETGRLSDYVLATTPQYERHDLSGTQEMFFAENYVQYYPPVVEKPDSVAHDWEVFWTIGRAMGLALELKHMTTGTPFGQAPLVAPVDMQVKPEAEVMIQQICESRNLDFEALKAATRGIKPDLSDLRVSTPAEDSGARLDVCPNDIAQGLRRLRERADVDSRYRLSVRRMNWVMNSAYRNSKFSQSKFPMNFAYMNPQDMLAEGLSDGVRIDITTDSGQIIGTVRSDDTVRAGVISMPHCFGAINPEDDPEGVQGGHTGQLIPLDPQRAEAINFMPHKTGIPVSIQLRQ